MELISIVRATKEVSLIDTIGGKVKLYTSLTAQDNIDLMQKFPNTKDEVNMTERSLESIVKCFVEWNIGKDGQPLPCTIETLKQFSQRDVFLMLQTATGIRLLDSDGNMLSADEIAKKGRNA